MEPDPIQTPFSKALLTSVFVGFFSSIICLVYNIIYRDKTGFSPSDFINVSSLIFSVNLLFVVIGLIYSLFRKASKKGDILFCIVFALITAFLAWKSEGVNRSEDITLTMQFRGLLLGIILIVGVSASFLIPFLFHNRQFNNNVL